MTTENEIEVKRAIEAIVLVSDETVEPSLLAQLLEVPKDEIERLCDELAAEYEADNRGFMLKKIAGGYRFQTHVDLAPWVERYVLDGQVSRLSAAALETLSIIAYKQPISRNQIAAIRGVNADGVMRTLEARGYICEFARDPGPGRAVLYATTPLFLERLGLDTLDDLPALGDFVPSADVVEALETTLMVDAESALDSAAPIDDPAAPDTSESFDDSENAGASGNAGASETADASGNTASDDSEEE